MLLGSTPEGHRSNQGFLNQDTPVQQLCHPFAMMTRVTRERIERRTITETYYPHQPATRTTTNPEHGRRTRRSPQGGSLNAAPQGSRSYAMSSSSTPSANSATHPVGSSTDLFMALPPTSPEDEGISLARPSAFRGTPVFHRGSTLRHGSLRQSHSNRQQPSASSTAQNLPTSGPLEGADVTRGARPSVPLRSLARRSQTTPAHIAAPHVPHTNPPTPPAVQRVPPHPRSFERFHSKKYYVVIIGTGVGIFADWCVPCIILFF